MRAGWRAGVTGLGMACCLSAQVALIDITTTTGNIQKKIDEAGANDEIYFHAGTYNVNLTLKSNLTVSGEEAARTILQGSSANAPVFTLNGAKVVTVQRLTLVGAAPGIAIQNASSDIKIRNGIFALNANVNAVTVSADSTAAIENNTFFANGTALQLAADGSTAKYNIFSENSTAISAVSDNGIDYNCFAGNTTDGRQGGHATTGGKSLRFVDTTHRDFHLRTDSLCIDSAGSGTDIIDGSSLLDAGAYGGQYADPLPYPVGDLKATVTEDSNGTYQIALSWNGNASYLVDNAANPGKYTLFYDSKAGPPYEGGDALDAQGSLIASGVKTVDHPLTEFTLFGLTGAASVPAAPEGLTAAPSDRKLTVNWSSVPGATGYILYYGVDNVTENEVDTRDTSVSLTGLVNGVSYHLAVQAQIDKKYYLAVKVGDNTGRDHESDFTQTQATVGDPQLSSLSEPIAAVPEKLQAYPDLPNEGCFIATAAFGYYEAREIRPLRQFRDRYLLASSPGRAFVAWYYRHGPRAAQWLQQHPDYKPTVRILLAPLIGFAWLMVNYPLSALVFMLLSVLLPIAWRRWRAGEVT